MLADNKKNIILTGVPRSGTSLLTKLISKQPNTLCFSEPSWIKEIRFEGQTAKQFTQALSLKLNTIREDIRKGNPIELTVKKGTTQLPDNYYLRDKEGMTNLKQTISVFIEHSDDLLICVKANTIFTATLNKLICDESWDIFAVIRDPLYVLMSWRSLNIPVSKGKIKIGELYSEYLRQAVLEKDLLVRQVKILDWFYKTYYQHNCQTIPYELLVDEPAKILSKITKTFCISQTLSSSNSSHRYDSNEKSTIINALKSYCFFVQKYYNEYLDS